MVPAFRAGTVAGSCFTEGRATYCLCRELVRSWDAWLNAMP